MVVGLVTRREKDIACFYGLLERLEERVGGKRRLDEFTTGIGEPVRGVYFFFEHGEYRRGSHEDLRVVRVGTHGEDTDSRSSIWSRLFEHKMDHGRSVFRDHVRVALRNKYGQHNRSDHERCVSTYIGGMPFLWVKIDEAKSRKFIERNAVALLSNWRKCNPIDPSSKSWLGQYRYDPSRSDLSSSKLLNNRKVACSGLWNVHYVGKGYRTEFLEELHRFVDKTPKISPQSQTCIEQDRI